LMTAPPKVSANAKANVDLPLAVGPAMTRTGGELSLHRPVGLQPGRFRE